MKFGTKIIIVVSILFFMIMSALAFSYWKAKSEYKNDFNARVNLAIESHKKQYKELNELAQKHYHDNKHKYHEWHQIAESLYKQGKKNNPEVVNDELFLYELKQTMINEYQLPADSEMFLINAEQTIFASTYKKDIGLDLSIFPKTSATLTKVLNEKDIYIPNLIAKDYQDQTYKLYSYSAIDDNTIFEMSFINEAASNLFQSQYFDSDSLLHSVPVHIFKENNSYFYLQKNDDVEAGDDTKAGRYKMSEKYSLTSHSDNPVIQAYFNGGLVVVEDEEKQSYTTFSKLYDNDVTEMPYENIVIATEVSKVDSNKTLSLIKNMFMVIAASFSLGLLLLHAFLQRYLVRPVNIIKASIDNSKLVPVETLYGQYDEFHNIATKYNAVYNELTQEIDRNRQMSMLDALTQISNRTEFDYDVEQLVTEFNEQNIPFCFALFDIDDFKTVNDNFGHSVGDTVLQKIASISRDYMQEKHSVYRFGGEEFAILMPTISLEESKVFLEHLRILIDNNFQSFRSESITISIGITNMQKGDDFMSLYKRVDAALYTAKKNGKNQVCIQTDV